MAQLKQLSAGSSQIIMMMFRAGIQRNKHNE